MDKIIAEKIMMIGKIIVIINKINKIKEKLITDKMNKIKVIIDFMYK